MKLERTFSGIVMQQGYWNANDRLLLAVSGGVDSIVLLHLVEHMKRPLFFGVVHVNHQLREASQQEADFLEEYCRQREIPFYTTEWQEGKTLLTGIEEKAREFRYHFFAEIAIKYGYTKLVTAHHSDDQAETILMKIVKGSALHNLSGIQAVREWKQSELVRPLLAFSKQELVEYAKNKQLQYFEDETNQELIFQRNRIRQKIIPELKKENTQFLDHIQQFSRQINYASEVIRQTIAPYFFNIMQQSDAKWRIDVLQFQTQSRSCQYFLLVELWQRVLISDGIEVNEKQTEAVLTILNSSKPQQDFTFKKGWKLMKRYQWAYLQTEAMDGITETDNSKLFLLAENQGQFLTEREWMGLFTVEQLTLPLAVKEWTKKELTISDPSLPLLVRKNQLADKIIFNQAQQKKKVSRIFIDQKIPREERAKTWVVEDQKKNILWVVPYKESYLSIPKETDKIQYRLIYLKDE